MTGPDPEGEHDRADPDRAAERPAGEEHGEFDGRPGSPDRTSRTGGGAGHEPIARTGPKVRREVDRTPEPDDHDAAQHQGELGRNGDGGRDEGDRDVGGGPDEDDVQERPQPGPLAERPPQREDRDAEEDAHGPDLQAEMVGDALVERLPRPEAQARLDHHRDAHAEERRGPGAGRAVAARPLEGRTVRASGHRSRTRRPAAQRPREVGQQRFGRQRTAEQVPQEVRRRARRAGREQPLGHERVPARSPSHHGPRSSRIRARTAAATIADKA